MPGARPISTAANQGQPARAGLYRVWHPAAGAFAGALPRLVQGLLVVALGLQGLHLAWVLLAPMEATDSSGAGFQPHRALDPDLARLAFSGASNASAAPGVEGIALLGVRRHRDASQSSAILAVGGGPQRAFGVGDEVRAGLRLQSVGGEFVTLEDASGLHRLSLPQTSAPPPGPPASVPNSDAPAAAPAPAGDVVDPRQLMTEAGLLPRLRNGRLDGFTLIERGGGQSLRSAGLRSGDVLLAVNGQELTPERLAEFGQMLQSGEGPRGTTTLILERDDQRHTVTFNTESP